MAEFRDDVDLDASQVEDVRGRGGGMMSRVPGGGGGIAVGGGTIGIIVTVLALLLGGGNPFGGGSGSPFGSLVGQEVGTAAPAGSSLAERCRTGADANQQEDCKMLGYINSIQKYWDAEFRRRGSRYQFANTVFFNQPRQSGCGVADPSTGPFYCPVDQKVYVDLGFFDELRRRFGARGNDFARAYVLAHEYGHHIENLTGVLDNARSQRTGPQSEPVRVELMADCLAGVWAKAAVSSGEFRSLTEQDIAEALDAAAAVGDDRIQKTVQGRVTPEKFTHGSSAQRQKWFNTGFRLGNLDSCDTFSGPV